MKQIVVAGGGFAGLTAIQMLRREGCDMPVVLVSPKPALFFYPGLIWVPAALRSERDLTVSLDGFLRRYQVDYHQGLISRLDAGAGRIETTTGTLNYDVLIIASGGRFLKKLPGIEHVFTPCEGYPAVAGIRDRLKEMEGGSIAFGFAANPAEPAAMRGGPIFELLFGIDTLLRKQGRRKRFDLTFFSPAAEPGKRLGARAVGRLLQEMRVRGIRAHLGHKIKGFTADRVVTEGGDIASDLTVFMPGMTGPDWVADSGLPLSEGGFVKADVHCRVPGFEGSVYVAGDAGSFPGPEWMPKQAHMADLQAQTLARNLVAELAGQEARHTFKVELICIVDTLDNGVLVYRDHKRNLLLRGFTLHWAKRFFEWMYLHRYRRAA